MKEMQSPANVSGVVPVMSSHCAGDVPPAFTATLYIVTINFRFSVKLGKISMALGHSIGARTGSKEVVGGSAEGLPLPAGPPQNDVSTLKITD